MNAFQPTADTWSMSIRKHAGVRTSYTRGLKQGEEKNIAALSGDTKSIG